MKLFESNNRGSLIFIIIMVPFGVLMDIQDYYYYYIMIINMIYCAKKRNIKNGFNIAYKIVSFSLFFIRN